MAAGIHTWEICFDEVSLDLKGYFYIPVSERWMNEDFIYGLEIIVYFSPGFGVAVSIDI